MLTKQNLPLDATHEVQNSIPIKIEGGAYQGMTFHTWGTRMNSLWNMSAKDAVHIHIKNTHTI